MRSHCLTEVPPGRVPVANVMSVPPFPSLAVTNALAVYWPSSTMWAVWTPPVEVSVPLRLLAASVKAHPRLAFLGGRDADALQVDLIIFDA